MNYPLDDLGRRLEELPREAWDRPLPPPAPWTADEVQPARRRGLILRPLVAVAASLALLAAGLGAGLLLAGDEDSPDDTRARVELAPLDGRGGDATGTVRLDPRAGGLATVTLSGLSPSAGGDFYEVWLLGDDGELVSLGSTRVGASGSATLENVPLPVDPGRFRFLDVSREPGDGDPGHSSVSVLRGPTA